MPSPKRETNDAVHSSRKSLIEKGARKRGASKGRIVVRTAAVVLLAKRANGRPNVSAGVARQITPGSRQATLFPLRASRVAGASRFGGSVPQQGRTRR